MRLVVTVAGPWARTPADLARVPAFADVVELRLDLLPIDGPKDVAAWVKASPRPVLATQRSAGQGGAFGGGGPDAAAYLLEAAAAGASWIDAEGPVVALVAAEALRLGARVLASVHGAGGAALPTEGVAAWKVARPSRSVDDADRVLGEARLLAAKSATGAIPPASVVPYGPLGAGLRVVTAAIAEGAGADPFVFGGPDETACHGLLEQPVLAHLLEEGRLGEVSGRTRLFGLIGRTPYRSPSPRLHDAVFRALGLDAVYLPSLDLPPEDAFRLPFAGFSVTTPWKEDAASRCDRLDPLAARIGAVNTVVRGFDGRLTGSNTDAEAVRIAVLEAGVTRGTALIVGGGGFARAAAVALGDAGLGVRLAGSDRARRAAASVGAEYAGPTAAIRPTDSVVVNATPLGADGRLPEPLAALVPALPPSAFVIDAPYAQDGRPGAFAAAGRGRGARVLDGYGLLLRQAEGQSARFTGRAPPPRVLAMALHPRTNLFLVGTRGAGKTSVGRSVAARLGRPFVDTDEEIARRIGRPAGRVLSERGEAAFRGHERTEVLRASSRCGVVIAVGGGALSVAGNAEALADHGFVVHLSVSAAEAARRIAADPRLRPRLTDAADPVAECARLIAARGPDYRRIARATVATDSRTADDVAEEVAGLWFMRRAEGVDE